MTARDFAYWLQGFFEITGKDAQITPSQAEMIRNHLDTVFVHMASQRSPEEQEALDEAHNPEGQKPSDVAQFIEEIRRGLIPVAPTKPTPYDGGSAMPPHWWPWDTITTC